MPDQFDVQRHLDGAAEQAADEAMGKLDGAEEEIQQRRAHLVQLDDHHFYDPIGTQVLLKDGSQFKKSDHYSDFVKHAVEKIEAEAVGKGFTPIQGGFFWNSVTKHLYVKNGGHYVLYALDASKQASQDHLQK